MSSSVERLLLLGGIQRIDLSRKIQEGDPYDRFRRNIEDLWKVSIRFLIEKDTLCQVEGILYGAPEEGHKTQVKAIVIIAPLGFRNFYPHKYFSSISVSFWATFKKRRILYEQFS